MKYKFSELNYDNISDSQMATIKDALKIREDAINELQTNYDSQKTTIDELNGQIKVLNSQIEEQKTNFDSTLKSQLKERAELERFLLQVNPQANLDGLIEPIEIKKEIVKSKLSNINLDGISEGELNGMLKAIKSQLTEPATNSPNFDAQKKQFQDAISGQATFNQDSQGTVNTFQRQADEKYNKGFAVLGGK